MAKAAKPKKEKLPKALEPPAENPAVPFLKSLHDELVKLIPGGGSVDERQMLADRVANLLQTL